MTKCTIAELKKEMIQQAKENWGEEITPCRKITTLGNCFTKMDMGKVTLLSFWFNDNNNSTHTVSRRLIKKRRKIL